MASQNEIISHDGLEENSNGITEKAVDRMQLRHRVPAPIPVVFINSNLIIRRNVYNNFQRTF